MEVRNRAGWRSVGRWRTGDAVASSRSAAVAWLGGGRAWAGAKDVGSREADGDGDGDALTGSGGSDGTSSNLATRGASCAAACERMGDGV